jgi:hypothetical protein
MQKRIYSIWTLFLALALSVSACNLPGRSTPSGTQPPIATTPAVTNPAPASAVPATDTPVPASPTPGYLSMPADPLTVVSKINDDFHPATTGDNYSINRYERPYQLDNTYRPDADIKFSFLADDGDWYYFSTQMVDVNPATKMMDAPYGVEIDTNLDGRGDFLLWATPPYTSTWTKSNVQVFFDTNQDVGNKHPLLSDAPSKGDGYETLIFDRGTGKDPDAAWVRQDPKDPSYLQIAVKKDTIGTKKFLWNPWTDFGVANPGLFDYNDIFTAQDAGSPYASNPNYPLKALFGMDNTCRGWYGFTPTGHEPGICGAVAAATKAPTAKPGITNTPVTPVSQPGAISGVVYIDNDGNGVQGAGDPGTNSYPLYLFAGTCTGSSISSTTPNSNGHYSFSNLAAGTYCLDLFYSGSSVLPGNPQTISVSNGNTTTVNFGIVPPG